MKTTKKEVGGTSFHGTVMNCSVSTLRKVLGEPVYDGNTGDDKVNFEWNMETNVAALNDIARSVTAYTFASHDSKEITKSLLEELPNVQAFWVHQEYPMLVEQGYCKALSKGMVGYDKL